MKNIYKPSTEEYYRVFNCGSNQILWTKDHDKAHNFKTEDSVNFVIDSFNLKDVEIVESIFDL